MRGPAPSIVCPRCGLEAPPADSIGKFTTCTKCSLSFDAAPRERLVSSRRPSPGELEPEPEPPPEPPPVLEDSRPHRIRHWRPNLAQGLVVIAVVCVVAFISTEYFPSKAQQARDAQLAEMRRDLAAQDAERLRNLEAANRLRDRPTTAELAAAARVAIRRSLAGRLHVEACAKLDALVVGPAPACAGSADTSPSEVAQIYTLLISGKHQPDGGCDLALQFIEASRKRAGCD